MSSLCANFVHLIIENIGPNIYFNLKGTLLNMNKRKIEKASNPSNIISLSVTLGLTECWVAHVKLDGNSLHHIRIMYSYLSLLKSQSKLENKCTFMLIFPVMFGLY